MHQATSVSPLVSAGPLVAAAAATAGGVLAGRAVPEYAGILAVATAGVALGAGLALTRSRLRRLGVGLAVTAVLLSSAANSAWRTAAVDARVLPGLAVQRADVTACGTATREGPRSVEVHLRTVESSTEAWKVREPVLLIGDEIDQVRAGQEVCLEGTARLPRRSDDQTATAVFLVPRSVEHHGVGSPIRRAAGMVRDRFRDRALGALPQEQAGLLLGMTTGDRTLLDEQTVESFRATGLAHLVAVSGFHVAVVMALVGLAVRALVPKGRWLRVAATAPPLVFFAFLVGLTPSVLRATVTAGIVLAVVASGRVSEGMRTASAAFVLLLFASPDLLFQPGFQMSFGATFGLILWAHGLSERLVSLWPFGFAEGPVKAASLLASTAVSAQLGVAPMLAAHFGEVPAAGGLANLMAVPLAPLVVGGGLVTLTLATLWSGLAWAPMLVLLPIDLILATAKRFSELPGASFDIGLPAAVALTAGGAALLTRSPRARAVLAALAVVLAAATCGRIAAERTLDCPGPHIRALDVGGTSVVIRSADAVVVADGGPAGANLAGRLRSLGVRKVDVAIASHPHADHTDGLAELVGSLEVGMVLAPATISWGTGKRLVEAAAGAGVPLVEASAGQVFEAGSGLRLEVLAPQNRPLPPEDPSLVNRYNLVVRATIQDTTVLLPGDADGTLQVLLAPGDVDADILVAPHHGSADLEGRFVEAVSPGLTLVTVDRHNPYGHPSPVAMTIYESHGAVFSTDRHGDILVCPESGRLAVLTQS